DGLIASAARHSRRSIVLSSFYRGQLPELHRLSIGPDLVLNGSASSTISPISAKSTSNRTAAGPDCAPLPARPSTQSAAPSALPYRPSSRRCRLSPEPRLWCLKRQMARKPLIINVVQIETAEVGSESNDIDGV